MSYNSAPAHFELNKTSKPSAIFRRQGGSVAFSASLTTATITITDQLSEEQPSQLQASLAARHGPLFRLKYLTYNVKTDQLPRFFTLITENIPRHVKIQETNIANRDCSVEAYIISRRVTGYVTHEVALELDADFDKQSFNPYNRMFFNTTMLQIRPPKAPQCFYDHLSKFNADITSVLKSFLPNVKCLRLFMGSTSYTQSVMKTLDQYQNIKILDLSYSTNPSISATSLQLSVSQSLSYVETIQELTLSGDLVSPELSFALGKLQPLKHFNTTGTLPVWGCLTRTPERTQKFSVLETLALDSCLENILCLPYLLKSVDTLRTLHILTPRLQSPMDEESWHNIARVFPNIESLPFLVDELNPAETVSWISLASITSFKNMKRLCIQHPAPLEVSNAFIQNLLIAWPNLLRLLLNPTPSNLVPWSSTTYYSSNHPTWGIVSYIANNNRALKSFSVYLSDTQNSNTVVNEHPDIEANTTLEKLAIGSLNALNLSTYPNLQIAFENAVIVNPLSTAVAA